MPLSAENEENRGSSPGWLSLPVIVLILANLTPVFGVLFFGWTVYPVVLFFWFENVVIGIFNVIKMLCAEPASITKWFAKFLYIPFFCLHYGIFTTIHGLIVMSLFGEEISRKAGVFLTTPFHDIHDQNLLFPAITLFISHGVSFFHSYLWKGEYKMASLQTLMAGPYVRLMILHATLIVGGILTVAFKGSMALLLLVVAIKIVLDVHAHNREREKFKTQETSNSAVFIPASSDDPLAMQTDWGPRKEGGSSIRTHKLVTINPNRLEFRTTVVDKLSVLSFLVLGLAIGGVFSYLKIFVDGKVPSLPIFAGFCLAIFCGHKLYTDATPIVFDRQKGFFWRGRKMPDNSNTGNPQPLAQLSDIHALQIILEYCPGSKGERGSYYSYELNLVLNNGDRLNVVDHGNLPRLRKDAGTLAAFLNVPLWDIVE